MLVLTRKKGESIVINGNITVKFLGNSRGEARIGVEAPRDIEVHREEVYLRAKGNQNAAD